MTTKKNPDTSLDETNDTEAETVEQVAPEDFDLDSWITGGMAHRPTRKVTIYRDLHLNADLVAAQERLAAIEQVTDKNGDAEEELGGNPEVAELEATIAELGQRLRSTSAVVSIVGLIGSETKAVEDAEFEPGTDAFTYEVLHRAATLAGRTLSPAQWEGLHATIGHAQWMRILEGYRAAQQIAPDVSAPFSPRSSRRVTGD